MKLVLVDSNNIYEYLDKMAKMEQKITNDLIKRDFAETFFSSGRDGIEKYIKLPNTNVYIRTTDEGEVVSSTFIAMYENPYQYDDLSKFFKSDIKRLVNHYRKHSLNDMYFEKKLLDSYNIKVEAMKKVTEKLGMNADDMKLALKQEKEKNNFNVKSELREKLLKLLFENIEDPKDKKLVIDLFLLTLEDIMKETSYSETDIENSKYVPVMEIFQDYFSLNIKQINIQDENKEKYYDANVYNTIDIEYMTDPDYKGKSITRKLVVDALSNKLDEYFQDHYKVYISMTVHPDNTQSLNIADFLKTTDEVIVERRPGIDRIVRMKCLTISDYKDYINSLREEIKEYEKNKGRILKDK